MLEFRVTLRSGIQYLLARNSLRLLIALPIASMGYIVLSRPDRTVGELLGVVGLPFNTAIMVNALIGLAFRERILASIDRHFFRDAYDRQQILLDLIESIESLKERDSIPDLIALVARRVEMALHATRSLVFLRNAEGELALAYSSDGGGGPALPSGFGGDMFPHADIDIVTQRELRRDSSAAGRRWIRRNGVDLGVPLTVPAGRSIGVLLLGAKRSEAYTRSDQGLLRMIGSQLGSACELILLREQVESGRKLQRQVLDRLDEKGIQILHECGRCGRCFDAATECPDDGSDAGPTVPVERIVASRYRLERRIAQGGMGTVFQASDLRLARQVAVKVMRGSLFGSDSARRRFTLQRLVACNKVDRFRTAAEACAALIPALRQCPPIPASRGDASTSRAPSS